MYFKSIAVFKAVTGRKLRQSFCCMKKGRAEKGGRGFEVYPSRTLSYACRIFIIMRPCYIENSSGVGEKCASIFQFL